MLSLRSLDKMHDATHMPLFKFSHNRFDLDLNETASEFHVSCDLPGVDKEDVDLSFDNGTLVISVEVEKETEKESEEGDPPTSYHIKERVVSSGVRRLYLGNDVDADHIDASFDKGVLHVKLPKSSTRGSLRKLTIK